MTEALHDAARSWRARTGLALALLLAALAGLFAVQWQAQADVTATDFYLDEASLPLGAADGEDDAGPGTVNVGSVLPYEFSACGAWDPGTQTCAGLSQPTAGALRVTIKLGANIILSDVVPGGPPSPTCTGVGTDTLVCTWSGPLAADTIFNLGFSATIPAGGYGGTPEIFTIEDLGSAQGPVAGTNQQTESVTATPIGASVTKIGAPTLLSALGGPVTWTITYSHVGTDDISAGNGAWTLTDTFDAPLYTQVTSVTVSGPAAATFACTPTPAVAPVTVSCSLTGGTITAYDTVTVTIVADVGPNTTYSRRIVNIATVDLTTDLGASATVVDDAWVDQQAFDALRKSASPTSLGAAGGTVAWTVQYVHPTNLPGVGVGDIVIQDVINDPAITSVTSVSDNSPDFACTTSPSSLPAAPPVTVTCTNTAAVDPGGSVDITIVTTVAGNPSANPRTISNLAVVTATIADVDFTDSQYAEVSQAGADIPQKQPLLAWAGQVVTLQHAWGVGCYDDGGSVLYTRQNGPGSFYPSGAWEVTAHQDEQGVSEALYESEDPGEVDVLASCGDETYRFLIYYMKFESLSTSLVPGSRAGHNSGAFVPANPWSTDNDVTSMSKNVSADVLVRVRVKGWTTSANHSGRPAATGANGETLPAGRWVLPDDWRQMAGGALAESTRPNWDIMVTPGTGFTCSDTDLSPDPNPSVFLDIVVLDSCTAQAPLPGAAAGSPLVHKRTQGPFSLLDGPMPGDSLAPSAGPGSGAKRQTWLPDRVINAADAPMPAAPVTISLSGSGFLKRADKDDIYNSNPYYVTHLPAEPSLPETGYLVDSWAKGAPYEFWDAAATGAAVYSAAGKDASKTTPGSDKESTGGYTSLTVYSDNHGEAMAWVNGDAGLTMAECATAPGAGTPANVVGVAGWYCEYGDKVGSSTITARVDYPQFRKHFAIQSNAVTVDWTWGGLKRVRVVDGPVPFQKYVVFEVTDRDGFCDDSPSLHPVLSDLGEKVEFLIDAGDGRIILVSGGGTIGTLGRDASTGVIPTDGNDDGQLDPGALPTPDLGVCQAWVLVSNSLLTRTNVLVTAYDPEGRITFDEVIDFTTTYTYTLQFRWNLVTWVGADGISPEDALRGTGPNTGGSDIFDRVTAVYGWNAATQQWTAFFPSGVEVPGVNNLAALETGEAYWVAITAPGPVSWTVVKDVD